MQEQRPGDRLAAAKFTQGQEIPYQPFALVHTNAVGMKAPPDLIDRVVIVPIFGGRLPLNRPVRGKKCDSVEGHQDTRQWSKPS